MHEQSHSWFNFLTVNFLKNNKCVSKTHIRQTRGVQSKLCATPSLPFQGQHFHRWLYASIYPILKIFKLMAASNARDKTPIDNWWPSRASSPSWHQHCDRVTRHTQDDSCVTWPRISGLACITDNVAKMLKKCNIFLPVMDSLGGYRPVT